MPAGTEPAPAPRFTRIFPALCPHPWAVPAPSHTALPADRAPGMSGQLPLPPDFLRDSSTPEENQYFSTHRRKEREKHSMGKGTRRMLLACLIPAARPRVPASRLAVGNATCFPSRTATGGGQSSAATSDRGASTPQVRGAGLVPPKLPRDPLELGWGAFAAMERMEMPHPTAHPVPNSHPSAGLGLAGNENCSKLGKVAEILKPSVMPELLMQGRSPSPPTLEHPGCQLQPLHIPPVASGGYPQPPGPGWDGFPSISLLPMDGAPATFLFSPQSAVQFNSNHHQLPSLLGVSRGQQPQSREMHLDSCFPSPALPEGPLKKQFILNWRERTCSSSSLH